MINIDTINQTIRTNLDSSECNFKTDSTDKACEFISRNYQCLEYQYLEQAKKSHSYVEFTDLKNVYLLDKELRMYLFNAIEEIEVCLKSFLFLNDSVNICDYNTYHSKYIDKNYRGYKEKNAITSVIDKLDNNYYKIFTELSFSDISKLIKGFFDGGKNKAFLKSLRFMLKENTNANLSDTMYNLSNLRNSIAHHDSVIYTVQEKMNFNTTKNRMKLILQKIYNIIQRIREYDQPSGKLRLLENIIQKRTKGNPNFREFLGYKRDFSDAISKS